MPMNSASEHHGIQPQSPQSNLPSIRGSRQRILMRTKDSRLRRFGRRRERLRTLTCWIVLQRPLQSLKKGTCAAWLTFAARDQTNPSLGDLIFSRTRKPDRFGSIISSTTASGTIECITLTAVLPSVTVCVTAPSARMARSMLPSTSGSSSTIRTDRPWSRVVLTRIIRERYCRPFKAGETDSQCIRTGANAFQIIDVSLAFYNGTFDPIKL